MDTFRERIVSKEGIFDCYCYMLNIYVDPNKKPLSRLTLFPDIRMATPTTPVKELPKEMLIGDRLKG